MPLKFTEKTILEVDYRELRRYICECYDLDSFAFLEMSNDSTHTFSVDGVVEDEDLVDESIDRQNIEVWALSDLLNDMCSKGYIKAGEYLLTVCW